MKEIKENPDKYVIDTSPRIKRSYNELYGYGKTDSWKNSPLNYSNLVRRGE